ncbi:MAG TPA: hypothetical protein VGR14_11765 [Verrucomicrobiae bacterium]|nr:hypothetical protein [Verrucomicrobiae bacterium]
MLYDATITTDPSGHLLLREPPSFENKVLQPLMALVPLGVGSLVMYVFLSGHGPRPTGGLGQSFFGWVALAIFFGALGVLPFGCGVNLLARRSYTIRAEDSELATHVTIIGIPLPTRRQGFSAFERVTVRRKKHGVFAKAWHFAVACEGKRRLDLSAFSDQAAAAEFAAAIGAQMKLPVVSGD